jgi:hypothetical protein
MGRCGRGGMTPSQNLGGPNIDIVMARFSGLSDNNKKYNIHSVEILIFLSIRRPSFGNLPRDHGIQLMKLT